MFPESFITLVQSSPQAIVLLEGRRVISHELAKQAEAIGALLAKVIFVWLLDPPDRVDPIEIHVTDGNFRLHHTRTACHWQPGSR